MTGDLLRRGEDRDTQEESQVTVETEIQALQL